MTRGDRCGRGARGASAAAFVISLVFLSGVGQAVGIRAGGLTVAAGGALGPAGARALAHSPACAPVAPGVHDFAPAVGRGRTVALTFDDGPGPSTREILAILADEQVPATFFNLGGSEELRPAEVRREVAGGYAMGNHTWDHAALPQLTPRQQAAELDRDSAEHVANVGGRPCLFRPPYGSYDDATLDVASKAGMALWNWSVDTEDWKAQGSVSSYWVHRITSRAEAGASQPHPVILMHDQVTPNPATVASLRPVIHFYRKRGFTFVDLYGRTWQAPAAGVARTAAGLHAFQVAPDGSVRVTTRVGGDWRRWQSLGGDAVGGVVAVAPSPRSVVVAGVGPDRRVRVRWARAGGVSRWDRIGGSVVGRVSLAASPDGEVTLVARGMDDAVWLRSWARGRWHHRRSLDGHLISAPAVAAVGRHGLVVVGVDTNGGLVERRRHGAVWGPWRSVGAVGAGEPSLAAMPDGKRAVLAVRSPDGGVRVRMLRASGEWGRWHRVVADVSSAVSVVVDGGGVRLVGVRRSDGALLASVGSPRLRAWTGWHRVGR
jgi:peptidoglycan/xylan/chitin deacetylase (PgdA/CDA1 family)